LIDFLSGHGYFTWLVPGIFNSDFTREDYRKTKTMITITPIAVSKVKEIITDRDASLGLRIAAVAGGCSGFQYQMTLDKQQEDGDESFDFEGLTVLVDAQSMLFLDGTTIDYVEARDGAGFTFDNPNAQSDCSSCGGGCSTE